MDEAVFSAKLAQLMDAGIETLRWCRQHAGERGVAQRLHALQLSISAMTLALNLEMDGELGLAIEALAVGDWDSHASMHNNPYFDERPE